MPNLFASLFISGLCAHLFADWMLQDEWQAINKTSLKHPAAWVHSGIHLLAMLLVFPVGVAFALAGAHILIDTRKPLLWWGKLIRQTTEGPIAIHVSIWRDQVAHILLIYAAAYMVGR